MKRILFLLILFCLQKALYAQQPYIYTIKADSVKITNTCDTAELIIENHTQNVPGFLFNKGRGRTEFRKAFVKVNDSIYVFGGDTLNLSNAWLQGGNKFGSAGILGTTDNFDLRFFTNNTEKIHVTTGGRVGIGTSTPLAKLHIVDTVGTSNAQVLVSANANAFPNYQIKNSNSGVSAGAGMLMFNNADQFLQYYMGSTNNVFVPGGALIRTTGSLGMNITADYGVIAFGRSPYIGQYEHARFLNNGNFGIGTQTPQARLHVMGTGIFTDTLTATTMGTGDSSNRVASTAFVKNAMGTSAPRKSATVTGSTYTVPADVEVVFVNYTAGQATLTLPSGTLDREITIKNLHTTNTVIISGLDTSESNSIATRGAITVKYTGSAWVGISKY